MVVKNLYYTSTNNRATHGNLEIKFDFDWLKGEWMEVPGGISKEEEEEEVSEKGTIRLKLAADNPIHLIHPNQRPYLRQILKKAWILPLDTLKKGEAT